MKYLANPSHVLMAIFNLKEAFNIFKKYLGLILLSACNSQPYQPTDTPSSPLTPAAYDKQARGTPQQSTFAVIAWQQETQFSIRGLAQHGMKTASGNPYDMYSMTAAHRFLALGTWIEISHHNGKKILLYINDRLKTNNEIDLSLSYLAAKQLGLTDKQHIKIHLRTRPDLAWLTRH